VALIFRTIRVLLALVVLTGTHALAQDVKEIVRTAPLAMDGRVTLDTHKGSVDIATWDRPAIEVHARIEPDSFSFNGEEQVRATDVRIDSSPNSMRIQTDYGRLADRWSIFGFGRPAVHYTIRMPRTARLLIRDYRSDIRIGRLQGGLELNTYRGSAVIASVEGPLRLETNRGRIRVEAARITARSRVDTQRGDVELAIPRGSGFELDADLGRRASLSGDYGTWSRSRARSRRIADSFNGGGPLLRVRCERGALRLTRA
jgi:hypothetical protein